MNTDSQFQRIAVIAPLGWALRNWVLSEFLTTLSRHANVTVLTPQAEVLRQHVKIRGVDFERLDVKPLGRIRQRITTLMDYSHYYRTPTYLNHWLMTLSLKDWPWRTRLQNTMLKASARAAHKWLSQKWVQRIEQVTLGLMAESRRMEELLRDREIDLVFSTMPVTLHYERPVLWAAQRANISTACFITSWDNLFSKGSLPIEYSLYMVWSEWMKSVLRSHYPTIPLDRIKVVGSPQFDAYKRHDLIQRRSDFLKSIGGDPGRKLVFWSGVSPGQLPGEPIMIASFCERIRRGDVHGDPQILFRPHPIGGGKRYAALRERYPEILFTETNDSDTNHLIKWMPRLEDTALLVNSVTHCDVNINHCSTMTLDCSLVGRPVVNLAFDVNPGSAMEEYVREGYKFDHYRTVLESGAVRMAYTLDELVQHVNSYLQDPSLDADGRVKLVKLHCGHSDGKAAVRAAECLGLSERTQQPIVASSLA